MRTHRIVLGALAAFGLCFGLPAVMAGGQNKAEVYYQGSIMNFALANERIICNKLETLEQLFHDIRQLGDAVAYPLLRKPLIAQPIGKALLKVEILAKAPISAGLIAADCKPAPPLLFIVAATHVDWIEDHELVTTIVLDNAMQMYATYFFDIRVLYPAPGSLEAQRFLAMGKAMAAAANPPVEMPSTRSIQPYAWHPQGEAR